jgi:adenylate kinase family enzyme
MIQRLVVVGAPGSGKSTLARQLGECSGLPIFERDGLGALGSMIYRDNVARMLQEPAWIFDGFPFYVDDDVYSAADTVVALDYAKRIVMWRVLSRSLRLIGGQPIGAHGRGGVRSWFAADHAVRVAWTKYDERRAEIRQLNSQPALQRKTILRFATPHDAKRWFDSTCSGGQS